MIEINPSAPFWGLISIGNKMQTKQAKSNGLVIQVISQEMKFFPVKKFIADSQQVWQL